MRDSNWYRIGRAPQSSATRTALGMLILAGVLFSASPGIGAGQGGAAVTIADLAWMSGAWEVDAGPVRIEEYWTEAAGNALLGMSRTLRGQTMVAFEYLRVEARADGIYYVAHPKARPGTDFKLTKLENGKAIFENPSHDFPKRIIYQRNADGSVTARVDGGEGVEKGAENFPFKKKK